MGEQEPRLRPQLGLVDATAVALGAIIGAGVFVALGQAAGAAGPALPLAVLLAALVATFNGLSAAELGVNYPRAGGGYEFGHRLLRPVAGFAAGWVFLLAGVAGGATYTLTFATYLEPLLPGVPLRAVGVLLALLALAVNAVGVQASRTTNDLLVALKVGALVVFIGVGLVAVDLGNLGLGAASPGGVFAAAGLVFFAFAGYARPVTIVEEVRDPARNLPRAVIAALGASTALYLGVSLVALGLVGAEGLAQSPAPLSAALAPTGQAWAQVLLAFGALVATTSVLLTELWGVSRLAFAMARGGDLPAPLSRLTPDGVPRLAILIVGGAIVVLTAAVDLRPALAAASLGLLISYGITSGAARRRGPGQRLYPPLVPAAGLASCTVLAFSLPLQALAVVGGGLAVGLLYYALRHR